MCQEPWAHARFFTSENNFRTSQFEATWSLFRSDFNINLRTRSVERHLGKWEHPPKHGRASSSESHLTLMVWLVSDVTSQRVAKEIRRHRGRFLMYFEYM